MLIADQLKSIRSASGRICYDRRVLDACNDILLANRSAYEALRVSGLMRLPDPDHLHKLRGSRRAEEGCSPRRLEQLKAETSDFTQQERLVNLCLDEINISRGTILQVSREDGEDRYTYIGHTSGVLDASRLFHPPAKSRRRASFATGLRATRSSIPLLRSSGRRTATSGEPGLQSTVRRG